MPYSESNFYSLIAEIARFAKKYGSVNYELLDVLCKLYGINIKENENV